MLSDAGGMGASSVPQQDGGRCWGALPPTPDSDPDSMRVATRYLASPTTEDASSTRAHPHSIRAVEENHMGERTQAFIERFQQVNTEVILTVERCSEPAWQAQCPDDRRTV